jgi:hypothetical protein
VGTTINSRSTIDVINTQEQIEMKKIAISEALPWHDPKDDDDVLQRFKAAATFIEAAEVAVEFAQKAQEIIKRGNLPKGEDLSDACFDAMEAWGAVDTLLNKQQQNKKAKPKNKKPKTKSSNRKARA